MYLINIVSKCTTKSERTKRRNKFKIIMGDFSNQNNEIIKIIEILNDINLLNLANIYRTVYPKTGG